MPLEFTHLSVDAKWRRREFPHFLDKSPLIALLCLKIRQRDSKGKGISFPASVKEDALVVGGREGNRGRSPIL